MNIKKIAAACVALPLTVMSLATRADNPVWTLNQTLSGTSYSYATAGIWTDGEGITRTWDASSAISYVVPVGFVLKSPLDNTSGGYSREFSSNPETTLTLEKGSGQNNASCAWMMSKTKTLTIPALIVKDWSLISFGNYKDDGYATQELKGNIRIDANASAPVRIRAHANNNSVQTVSAAITGTGALLFFPENRNAKKAGKIVLSGDNSGYFGNVIIASDNQSTMTLAVSSSENLGGNPESFARRGLEIGAKATLEVTGDATLGANRGLYVSDDSTVSVAPGKTFSVPSAIAFEPGRTLTKTGAGMLAIPGDISGWAVDQGTIALTAGTLALESAVVVVSDGTVTPVAIGALTSASGGVQVSFRVTGDGSELSYNTSYTLLSSTADLPDGFANMVNVVLDEGAFTLPAGAVAQYSVVDGKKFVMTVGSYSGDPVWVGGADAKFSNAENWLGGIKPEANSSAPLAFAAASAGTVENDIEGLSPVSVAFRAGCAALTIGGNALNIPAGGTIANNSSETPVFNAAVAFAQTIDVTGSVNFAGGVTGTVPANHTTYLGKYTLSADEWTPPEGAVVPSGSEIRMQGTLLNAQGLSIRSGGAVYAGSLTRDYYGDYGTRWHQLYENVGALSVGEMRWTGYISSTSGPATFYPVRVRTGSGAVVFRTGKLVNGVLAGNGTKQSVVFLGNDEWENVFVIGSGGIAFERPEGATSWNAQYQLQDKVTVTLAPTADWALHESSSDNKRGIYMPTDKATLNISTSDYDHPDVPHTITIESSILDGGTFYEGRDYRCTINITGIGSVVYAYSNHDSSNGTLYRALLNVKDSATFALKPGCSLGTATFSFADTSTLKVPQSGTVEFGGSLVLGANANLAFNFTEAGAAPVLSGTAVTAGDSVNVKVSSETDVRPRRSSFALTSGMDFSGKTVNLVDPPEWAKGASVVDGNIVLAVKPVGLMILFR